MSSGGITGGGAAELEERGSGGLLQREHAIARTQRAFHMDRRQSGGGVIGSQLVDLKRADEGDGGGFSIDGDADVGEGSGQAPILEIGVASGARDGGERSTEEGNPGSGSNRGAEAGGADHSAGCDGGLLHQRWRRDGECHGDSERTVGDAADGYGERAVIHGRGEMAEGATVSHLPFGGAADTAA